MVMKIRAKATVTRVAFKGSLFLKLPLARKVLMGLVGKMSSAASAFKVLGATIRVPKAEEMVAQARPMGMMGPHTAIFDITN